MRSCEHKPQSGKLYFCACEDATYLHGDTNIPPNVGIMCDHVGRHLLDGQQGTWGQALRREYLQVPPSCTGVGLFRIEGVTPKPRHGLPFGAWENVLSFARCSSSGVRVSGAIAYHSFQMMV